MCEESLKALDKLVKRYKSTPSKLIRNMLLRRQSLKTLKEIDLQIQNNKKSRLLISSIPSNINQIAHRLNEDNKNFVWEESEFFEMYEEIREDIKWHTKAIEHNNIMLENLY